MQKTTIYLTEEDRKYIEEYKNNYKKGSIGECIRCIIAEHKMKSEMTMDSIYEFIATKVSSELNTTLKETITKELVNTLKPLLNSLKFATNSSCKDIQIALEMLNGIYYKQDLGTIPNTEIQPTKAYSLSKKFVEENIIKQHIKKSKSID